MVKSTQKKEDIRKKVLELRCAIEVQQRMIAEERIRRRLFDTEFYRTVSSVYCYISVRDEVDTWKIIEASLQSGKRVALPKVIGKRKMDFFFINAPGDLVPGAWSIPEPGPSCARAPQPGEGALVIMPGVAFDRWGRRIGYGGGYYDAYLSENRLCKKAALAFSLQCVEELPEEEHDVRPEYIITEKELIIC